MDSTGTDGSARLHQLHALEVRQRYRTSSQPVPAAAAARMMDAAASLRLSADDLVLALPIADLVETAFARGSECWVERALPWMAAMPWISLPIRAICATVENQRGHPEHPASAIARESSSSILAGPTMSSISRQGLTMVVRSVSGKRRRPGGRAPGDRLAVRCSNSESCPVDEGAYRRSAYRLEPSSCMRARLASPARANSCASIVVSFVRGIRWGLRSGRRCVISQDKYGRAVRRPFPAMSPAARRCCGDRS